MVLTLMGQWLKFKLRLQRASTEASPELQRVTDGLAAMLGTGRQVRVRCSAAVTVPCLVGVLDPQIYLPVQLLENLTTAQLRHVIAHELGHVKRHDLLAGWVSSLLCCVYWFHPLVWVAHLNLRREREMATDDVVLRNSGEEAEGYTSTLLEVAGAARGGAPMAAGFVGALEAGENLLQRIRSAADPCRARRMGWGSRGVLAVAMLLLPMAVWTADSPPTATVMDEIVQYYAKAPADVQEYVQWTANNFGRSGLWLPENALENLTAEEREQKIMHYAEALQGEYGRHLCQAIVEAGVLKDKRLLPGLLKVATYHRDDADYDCRPKWMAVEALGRLGSEEAVPALIPLVDHGNQNTRMWAQASLVRLTGQSLGADKKAWGNWWNSTGKQPALSVEALKPWTPPAGATPAQQATPAEANAQQPAEAAPKTMTPPEITSSTPAFGATEVDPATTELRVTFDQDMAEGFSWTGGGDVYPETTGAPHWVDKRTCALPVKLQPGKFYRLGINSKSHRNFKSAEGMPARIRAFTFVTAGAAPEELAKAAAPEVRTLSPENGAQAVPPTLEQLAVVFNLPMGGGFSWTKAGGLYPQTTGAPHWSEDKLTCYLPVKLQPDTGYTIGLNHAFAINFCSQWGVPLEPVVWKFKTAK